MKTEPHILQIISAWIGKKERVPSQYGMVTGDQWCHLEVERNRALGGQPCIVIEYCNKVAVARMGTEDKL
jgi:hypothetical protein